MKSDLKSGKLTATIQQVTSYNLLLTEAIFDILTDKGILTAEEVKERLQKLQRKTHLAFRQLR